MSLRPILAGVAVGLAFVALLAIVILTMDRERVVRSCERANVLYAEVIDLTIALGDVGREAAGFARDAAEARRGDGQPGRAREYERRARRILDALAEVDPPRPVRCRDTIPLVPLSSELEGARDAGARPELPPPSGP